MSGKFKSFKDGFNNKLEQYKIKRGFSYMNKSVNALYKKMHKSIEWAGKFLAKQGISANWVSIAGFAVGLLAINFLAMNMYAYALLCILVNRLFDSLDGEIARRSKITDFGIFLDASLDYVFYAGAIFGFALANPMQNAVAASFLLFGFTASACAMLAYAVIAYKNKVSSKVVLDKSPMYFGGFVQGFETFVAIVVMCLLPGWFMEIAIFLGTLCLIKAFGIMATAYYNFVIAAKNNSK